MLSNSACISCTPKWTVKRHFIGMHCPASRGHQDTCQAAGTKAAGVHLNHGVKVGIIGRRARLQGCMEVGAACLSPPVDTLVKFQGRRR